MHIKDIPKEVKKELKRKRKNYLRKLRRREEAPFKKAETANRRKERDLLIYTEFQKEYKKRIILVGNKKISEKELSVISICRFLYASGLGTSPEVIGKHYVRINKNKI
jgi:hypothetical protein